MTAAAVSLPTLVQTRLQRAGLGAAVVTEGFAVVVTAGAGAAVVGAVAEHQPS